MELGERTCPVNTPTRYDVTPALPPLEAVRLSPWDGGREAESVPATQPRCGARQRHHVAGWAGQRTCPHPIKSNRLPRNTPIAYGAGSKRPLFQEHHPGCVTLIQSAGSLAQSLSKVSLHKKRSLLHPTNTALTVSALQRQLPPHHPSWVHQQGLCGERAGSAIRTPAASLPTPMQWGYRSRGSGARFSAVPAS